MSDYGENVESRYHEAQRQQRIDRAIDSAIGSLVRFAESLELRDRQRAACWMGAAAGKLVEQNFTQGQLAGDREAIGEDAKNRLVEHHRGLEFLASQGAVETVKSEVTIAHEQPL